MRKSFVALLLLFGVAVSANLALADDLRGDLGEGLKLTNAQMIKELGSRAAKLRTSGPGTDTIYVGYTPGRFNASNNWWSIGAIHAGPGSHRPHTGAPGAMWDFDTPVNGDSLQGWWPVRHLYTSTGGQTRTDRNRAWWCNDVGNNASYAGYSGPAGPTGQKRTFGVIGVWHVDGGSLQPSNGAPGTPTWAPLAGSRSAWMGLRGHGDTSGGAAAKDALTNNNFNEDVLSYNGQDAISASGNDFGFPGYGSQMDQMLYRDIDMSAVPSSNLTVNFRYRTNMSTDFGTAPGTRSGWFDKDPVAPTSGAVNPQPNNFISSSDADTLAPCDSFMVYVGAPVTGSTFIASTGASYPVFDPLRRWFAETVRANESGLYRELLSVAGNHAAGLTGVTIPNSVLAPILSASGGKVRLVFRVKTNRGFDDMGTAYSSGGAGAAVVDNVTYTHAGGSSPAGWGEFENFADINNSASVDALNAWKSTGKPPSAQFHAHGGLGTSLPYDDLCGQPGDQSRICDMDGTVMSGGFHHLGEAAGGLVDGTTDRETITGVMSPTIQLVGNPGGVYPNAIGLADAAAADATEDYYADFEIYAGIFDPFSKGGLWQYSFQAYPANAKAGSGGYPGWGQMRTPPYIIFNPDQQCFRDIGDHPAKANSQLKTSNPSGVPDSIRISARKWQQCFRFGVSAGCSPTDGAYWDNISLTLVDGEPAALGVSIWDLFQDSFPANDNAAIVGFPDRFDTTAAYIKSGLNISPQIGALRIDVPGDSAAVVGGDFLGTGVRTDMVFRILPGPGNYVNLNNGLSSRLRKLPNAVTEVANAPVITSTNFWESYLANNGAFGTAGGHPTNGTGQKIWSVNVWNSARCDTAEATGVFAMQGDGIQGGPLDPGIWQTTYHEAELTSRTGLGITRHRCFRRTDTAPTTQQDCVHDPPAQGSDYDLRWVTTAGSGYNGVPTTNEGTKILPDGYFTPGTHVEYFFRKSSTADGTLYGLMPDTGNVFPQNLEGSTDAHRWQEFSVLPDRWKETGRINPNGLAGLGNACLLVVDLNDRRGNERSWVGVADSLGATRANKYGAHNGWHAAGTGTATVNDPASFVAVHGGHPGTTWDMYQVKASESLTTSAGALGSRLAVQAVDAQMHGKESRQGPTPDMLDTYYKFILLLSGDLNSGVLGPFSQRSQDDVALLTNWLANGSTSAPGNRAFWAMGDGFVESNDGEGIGTPQFTFNTDILGVSLVRNSYTLESGNTELTPDLLSASAITTPSGGPCPYPTGCNFAGARWGVRNICLFTNDVIQAEPTSPVNTDMAAGNRYEGVAVYQAGELKKFSSTFPWIALVDGYDIENLTNYQDTGSRGRAQYFAAALANVFGQVCGTAGTPTISLDVPNTGGIRDFGFALGNNPMTAGSAAIYLSMPRGDRVSVKVYDVSGRLQATLADGQFFTAGTHTIRWDGVKADGSRAAKGVYFTQVRYLNSRIAMANKLTILH